MIIDSHVHLIGEGWNVRRVFLGIARMYAASMSKDVGEMPDPEAIVDSVLPVLSDTTGEKLVAAMDTAGVDKSCIFALDYGLATGEPEVLIEDQNRMIAEAGRRFPDRRFSCSAQRNRAPSAPPMTARRWKPDRTSQRAAVRYKDRRISSAS